MTTKISVSTTSGNLPSIQFGAACNLVTNKTGGMREV